MGNIDNNKRKWLALGGVALGASLIPNSVLAAISTAAPKTLNFYNVNTRERLSSKISGGVISSQSELNKLNYFMRDRRSLEVTNMDPMLFKKFYNLQSSLGLRNCELEIICGYRSPLTNASLRRRSKQVARKSYHMKGQAIDFRIKNISLSRVNSATKALKSGGVGYYPRSNFVHTDTGPVRTWRGS